MDSSMRRNLEAPMKASSSMTSDSSRNATPDQQDVRFNSLDQSYFARPGQSFPGFPPFFGAQSSNLHLPDVGEAKVADQFESNPALNNPALDWDPQTMLRNLNFLEQKIKQVKDIVQSMNNQGSQVADGSCELPAKQQLVTADLTCIIIQLISTAGCLLPSMKNPFSSNPAVRQLSSALGSPSGFVLNANLRPNNEVTIPQITKTSDYEGLMNSLNTTQDEIDEPIKCPNPCGGEGSEPIPTEDHDVKESDDGGEGENLPPGSYVVLQLEKEEILAPHTHFCLICGKGFKRDANLRMHMRGHGDEYKTPAALAKPTKDSCSEPTPVTRYSCPFVGCKRNKEHKKFQPLKTILCVKNHYKRSHCDKSYTCSRCNTKKFSVIADLKTHEKHCGRDKWLCSCGTTFSRKDKLFGHVALFQGHTPALPMDDIKVPGALEQSQAGELGELMNEMERSMGYNFAASTSDSISNLDMKMVDDTRGYFSPLNFDPCNFAGLDDFTRPGIDISENPFSFLPSGSCGFGQENGDS